MKKNTTLWGIALTAVLGTGVVVAAGLAPVGIQKEAAAENGVAYTLDPAAGSVVSDLQMVTINFPDNEGVTYTENYTNSIVLTNTTTGVDYLVAGADLQTRSMNPGTTYVLHFLADGEDQVAPVTAPGAYVLGIKEGAFQTNDGEKVQAISAEYSISGIQVALDPAAGSEVDDLSVISINFPDNKGVEFFENYTNSIVLVNNDTAEEYVLLGDPDLSTDRSISGTTYTMHFVSASDENVTEVTAPGSYTLNIKEGAFTYAEAEGEEAQKVQAISANYVINGVAYTVAPQVEGNLGVLNINFPNSQVVDYVEQTNNVLLTNTTTGDVYVLAGEPDMLTDKSVPGVTYAMHFALEGEDDATDITAPGKYVLQIKKGAFVADGKMMQEVEENFSINMECTFTPAAGEVVDDLSVVTLNIPVKGAEYVPQTNNILLINNTTGVSYVLAGDPDVNTKSMNGGTEFTMHFVAEGEEDVTPITTPGAYTLKIKEGAFVYGEGYKVEALSAYYDIEGMDYTVAPQVEGNFNAFVLTFPEKGVELMENYAQNSIMLVNLTTGAEYIGDAERNTMTMSNGTEFTLHFIADGEEELADIMEAGNYELKIKKGTFVYNNGDSKIQAINADFFLDLFYTMVPQTENDLSVITLNFPVKGVVFTENITVPGVLVNNATGTEYLLAGADMNTYSENGGTTFELHFIADGEEDAAPITAAGDYTLNIKKGAFEFGINPTPVQAMTADFNVEMAYTFNPAAGSEVKDLSVINITFAERGVEFVENYLNSIVLQNQFTGDMYVLAGDPDFLTDRSVEGTTYSMHFVLEGEEDVTPITNPGSYLLAIKEGAFTYGENSTKVQAISAEFNVEMSYTAAPVVEGDLSVISINFGALGVEYVEQTNNILLTNNTTGENYVLAGDPDFITDRSVPGTTYQLHFVAEGEEEVTPILTAGDYTLNIKKGAFTYNDGMEMVQPIAIDFSIDLAYSVNPVVENDLSVISINFPVNGVEYVEQTNNILLTNNATGESYVLAGEPDFMTDRSVAGTTYQMHFVAEGEDDVTPITAPGEYTLAIKKGAFTYGENTTMVQAITSDLMVEMGYTFNPAEGSEVKDLSVINITFAERGVEFVENYLNSIVLQNQNTGDVYVLAGDPDFLTDRSVEGTTYSMHFVLEGEEEVTPITTPGSYLLAIKNGAFTFNEGASKVQAITAEFGVEMTYAIAPVVEGDLSVISINFAQLGVEYVEQTNNILLTNNTTGENYVLAGNPDFMTDRSVEGTTYQMHFVLEGEEDVTPITTSGDYTLSIKKGAFTYNDGMNMVQAITDNFYIGLAYTLTPANGSVVDDLSVISINFPVRGVEFMANFTNSVVLTNETTGDVYVLAGDPDFLTDRSVEGTTYEMHFVLEGEEEVAPITAPGAYTLAIKKGAFVYGDNNTQIQTIEAAYSIESGYTLTPAAGNVVEDLSVVTINFSAEGVEFFENYTNSVLLTNLSTGDVYVLAGADLQTRSMNPGTTFALHFIAEDADQVEPIVAAGHYMLQIKKGAFVFGDNNTQVQAIEADYTIGLTCEFDPMNGNTVEDLSVIRINFPYNVGVDFMANYENSVVLENVTTSTIYVLAGDPDFVADRSLAGTTYDMHFVLEGEEDVEPITEAGTYMLRMKKGAFVFDGIQLDETMAVYVIDTRDGVDSIFGNAAEFDVYTINGMKVLDKASKDAVNELANGLYIINGKKVLIRK